MKYIARIMQLGCAAFGIAMVLGAQAHAQEADNAKPAVIVNGHEITAEEIELAADDILPELKKIPANLRYAFVVEYLIERHLLAQHALSLGIADTDEYKRRLRFYNAKALRDALFIEKLKPTVTEDSIRATYDQQAAKVEAVERVRARHIVVASEDEAKALAQQIKAGATFEDLAKQHSIDGSKQFGGDLGFFSKEEMAPAFSAAAFALKPGEVSAPVKTSFGWHLIKVEEFKEEVAQPYEEVKDAIKLVLLRNAVQNQVLALRASGDVQILDEDLKELEKEVERQRKKLRERREQQGDGSASE